MQANKAQENERQYTIRKRPASVASSISSSGGNASTDRTTFVCYTCGVDSPSSQLHLVYCCSNAEREPYYPFIKDLEPFQNASPISPQGKYCTVVAYFIEIYHSLFLRTYMQILDVKFMHSDVEIFSEGIF